MRKRGEFTICPVFCYPHQGTEVLVEVSCVRMKVKSPWIPCVIGTGHE